MRVSSFHFGSRLQAKFAGYLITGGIAAIIDLGGFLLLIEAGFALWLSASVSFTVAAAVNFALSSKLVFADRIDARRFPLFFAVALVGLAVNAGTTTALSHLWGFSPALAKITGIGTAFLLNFTANAFLVFGDRGGLSRPGQ